MKENPQSSANFDPLKGVSPLESIKILDPAGGSGAFLNQVHTYLAKKYAEIANQEALKSGLESFATIDQSQIDKSILQNNIFMVDLQPESVEIAKLSLWLKTAKKDQKLNNLDANIKCGNSLISDPEIAGDRAFDWEKEFPQIFLKIIPPSTTLRGNTPVNYVGTIPPSTALTPPLEGEGLNNEITPFKGSKSKTLGVYQGGFDVIVGNPPYGAKLSQQEQEYLLKKYNFGTTETAILFILKSLDLLSDGGYIGFIIPKSFCFASNYQKIRELVWDNVVQIVDCGKVWDEVKLEQIIVIIQKGVKHDFYINKTRNGEKFENEIKIEKNIAKEFGFFLNGISEDDILRAKKMLENSVMLNDIAENRRGAMLQKLISKEGELEVIGGAEISRDGIVGIKGKINKVDVNDEKAYIKPNSVLVQRIVAHIENPEPHIKITACLPEKSDYILVDTINQITLKDGFLMKFIYTVLNSDILNWYVYNFVIGRAIRTIQFDNPTTSKLPIPKATPEQQTQIAELVDKIMELKKNSHNQINSFLKLIEAKYKPSQISSKLKKWYELETSNFLDELKKQKAQISLSEQAELITYFEAQKAKVLKSQASAEKVDEEIEKLVRGLYDLK